MVDALALTIDEDVALGTFRVASSATSQDKLLRVADRYRRSFARLALDPIEDARASVSLASLEMLVQIGEPAAVIAYLERVIVGIDTPFRVAAKSKVSTLILDINEAAANATRCDFTKKCLTKFSKVVPEAVIHAEAHAAELVTAVSAESRRAVNGVVQRVFAEGISPKRAASLIQQTIGLTEVQMNAVVNLQQRILTSPGSVVYAGRTRIRVPKTGMTAANLDKATRKYAERLTRQRALTIARTETVRSANEGQIELWKQARMRGELPSSIRHEWVLGSAERTCPVCTSASGEIVRVGDAFSTGTASPPAHPSCRCSTGLVM